MARAAAPSLLAVARRRLRPRAAPRGTGRRPAAASSSAWSTATRSTSTSAAGASSGCASLGIDTPETVDPDRPVECHGPEASALARQLAARRAPSCGSSGTTEARDRYGRLLAYVFRADDGLFVNEAIVAAGDGRAARPSRPTSPTPSALAAAAADGPGGRRGPVGCVRRAP